MQELTLSFRGRSISEEDLERFRCLLDDCTGGKSPRLGPQWPQWVRYRHSLRASYTISGHADDPARLRRLTMPVLVVTGTETVPFHRQINRTLLELLRQAKSLDVRGGHNAPVVSPDHFASEWVAFQQHVR